MKKAGIILLLSIYSLSILGVNLKKFYCCGKLKSVTVTIGRETANRTDDGCCKTRYQSFKVKDHHVNTAVVSLPQKNCIDLLPVLSFFEVQPESLKIDRTNSSHDPPGKQTTPSYILNRIFRI